MSYWAVCCTLCTVCWVVLCVLSCVLYIEYGAGMLRSVLYVEQSTVWWAAWWLNNMLYSELHAISTVSTTDLWWVLCCMDLEQHVVWQVACSNRVDCSALFKLGWIFVFISVQKACWAECCVVSDVLWLTTLGRGWKVNKLAVERQHNVQSCRELAQAGALQELLQGTQQLFRFPIILHTK